MGSLCHLPTSQGGWGTFNAVSYTMHRQLGTRLISTNQIGATTSATFPMDSVYFICLQGFSTCHGIYVIWWLSQIEFYVITWQQVILTCSCHGKPNPLIYIKENSTSTLCIYKRSTYNKLNYQQFSSRFNKYTLQNDIIW